MVYAKIINRDGDEMDWKILSHVKNQFDKKNNIETIYKISSSKVLGLVFSSLAATTLARSLDKRGERRKVVELGFDFKHLTTFTSQNISFQEDLALAVTHVLAANGNNDQAQNVWKTTILWLSKSLIRVLANAFKK